MIESELAVNFAVKRGYPADYFVQFPNHALSTEEEARLVIPELRRLGVHSFLLVTTDYHTRPRGPLLPPARRGVRHASDRRAR